MGKVYKKVFTNYGLPENLRGRSDKSNILQIQRKCTQNNRQAFVH